MESLDIQHLVRFHIERFLIIDVIRHAHHASKASLQRFPKIRKITLEVLFRKNRVNRLSARKALRGAFC
jgi:hypothetical protein